MNSLYALTTQLPSSTYSLPSAHNKIDVVVIDDNTEAADLLVMLIEVHGHSAKACYCGLDGIDAARDLRPYLIITDIVMDNVTGYDVLDAVHHIDPSYCPAVVALTGFDPSKTLRSPDKLQFDFRLIKPMTVEDLAMVLSWPAVSRP